MPSPSGATTNDLSSTLQRGLFEEEANRNLDAAAQAYQTVSAQFDKDRALAATAIFRLGEIYRKQNKTNEAAAQYERIVREFSDQNTLVTLSHQNIVGLGGAVQTRATVAASTATVDNLQSQYALLKAQLEQARKETNVLTIAKLLDDADLRETLQNERQVVRTPEAQQKILDAAAARAVDYAEKRLSILQSVIAQARSAQSPTTADQEPSATTDDEEKEIRRIQEMIQNSPDLINAPRGGSTPLISAANAGQLRVAAFLLDHRADVNLKSGNLNPLLGAAANGNKAMVELLLNRGAEVNAQDGGGRTALHTAAASGFVSVMETLLLHKADVNVRDSEKNGQQTPLHLAASAGHGAIVKLLVASGADVNAKNSNGGTPLLEAAAKGHRDTAAALLDLKADVNAATDEGRTSLHAAAEAGHLEVVTLLLERNASVNVQNNDKATPLLLAVFNQRTDVVKMLLEHKADPDLAGAPRKWQGSSQDQGYYVATPVFYSIKKRETADILALLLEHGADPDRSQTPGWRPLFDAIQDGKVWAVKLLLAHKAEPNKPDYEGNAPLLKGIQNVEFVRLLLEAGADPNARDKDGWPAIIQTINSDSPAILKLLLEHNADVNAIGPDGWTALHAAAGRGMRELVELLLAYKADVNARKNNGDTPIDLAKRNANRNQPPGIQPIPNRLNAPWTVPLSYQWSKSSPTGSTTNDPPSLPDLLRQHGALDDLPILDRIEVKRPSSGYSAVVFWKGTNNWNQVTLLELIGVEYGILATQPNPRRVGYPENNLKYWAVENERGLGNSLPFPDFSRVTIHRPTADGTNRQVMAVNVLSILNSGDCSKDLTLKWGDQVEIPELDHTVAEQWSGFAVEALQTLAKCLTRKVTLSLKDQTIPLELRPSIQIEDGKLIGLASNRPFSLSPVLKDSKLLRVSSDLTRVKLSRKAGPNGKPAEWIVDCSAGKSPDLWLRDGDVIEVPDKP